MADQLIRPDPGTKSKIEGGSAVRSQISSVSHTCHACVRPSRTCVQPIQITLLFPRGVQLAMDLAVSTACTWDCCLDLGHMLGRVGWPHGVLGRWVQAYLPKTPVNFVPLFCVIWWQCALIPARYYFMVPWKEVLSGFFLENSASGRDPKSPPGKVLFSTFSARCAALY